MAKEIIEVKSVAESNPGMLVVTERDVENLKNQQKLLAKVVRSQLKEADFKDAKSAAYGEGDYGIIPGTKKRCLFKQGAEKLQRLFRLGCRFRLVDKEIDRTNNFAMFTYRCEIYSLVSGVVIAECDGSTNSGEIKYKERTTWKEVGKDRNGKPIRESFKEQTPVSDVLNTLMKMAQKRAMIGATLIATGASQYFTQDLLDPEDLPRNEQGTENKDAQATSSDQEQAEETAQEAVPVCCGQDMMISKYHDKDLNCTPWYCMKCKKKVPR